MHTPSWCHSHFPSAPAPAAQSFALSTAITRVLTRPIAEPKPLRRIFMVGCPRSGTTVVQAMLAERGGLMTLPETHAFKHLLGALEEWIAADSARALRRWNSRLIYARANTHRRLSDALAGVLNGRRLARHFSGRGYAAEFVRVLDRAAADEGCTGWLEKTPEHFAYIEMIQALCPDALFVHVLRAGEDVVASAVDAELRFADQQAFGGGAAFWVRHWNRAAETHLRYAGQPRHWVVCHEDIVRDSQRSVAELLEFAAVSPPQPRATQPGRIADLRHEPWKRSALNGTVVAPERKFEALFGPQAQRWIASRLHDYAALRAEIGRRQYRSAGLAR